MLRDLFDYCEFVSAATCEEVVQSVLALRVWIRQSREKVWLNAIELSVNGDITTDRLEPNTRR